MLNQFFTRFKTGHIHPRELSFDISGVDSSTGTIVASHVHEQRELNVAGFTLIEILVVIFILGILAAAVLVAINPSERINQANDSNRKAEVGQVAVAMEEYYTASLGNYDGLSPTILVSLSYLRRFPSLVTLTVSADNKSAAAYASLSSSSLGICADTRYWCYTSTDGSMTYKCLNHTPLSTCL